MCTHRLRYIHELCVCTIWDTQIGDTASEDGKHRRFLEKVQVHIKNENFVSLIQFKYIYISFQCFMSRK